MREKRRFPVFQLVLMAIVLIGSATSAEAYDFGYSRRASRDFGSSGSGSDQYSHSLSVAGGVAAPSSTGFRGENPAGLIYNQSGNILSYLATGKDRPDLLSNGFSFLAGNGLAAASVGVQTFNNATDDGGSITTFNFGMATYAEALDVSFGLSGAYRFQKREKAVDPALQDTWTADFGMLFNPFGSAQLGIQLYDLSKRVTAAGAGFAFQINSFSSFGVDASTNTHGRGLIVKPGVGVRAAALNLTYAYGKQVDDSATSGLSPGNTLGLGYEFSPQFSLIGYYNHFSTYYVGGTIKLF